jgi:hypothetical protein
MDMEWDTFEAALAVVKHFCDAGTQEELALTGIGESLMHPRFLEMVERSRETIGWQRALTLSTNGILLTDAMCAELAKQKLLLYVSLHRPEKAGLAIEIAKRHGIFAGANASAATSAMDWAGQVPGWFVSAPFVICEYLRSGWGVILADGRITTCCVDASGVGEIGTVHDDPAKLTLKPYSLCSSCHMQIPN